jgi:hypothetical protein
METCVNGMRNVGCTGYKKDHDGGQARAVAARNGAASLPDSRTFFIFPSAICQGAGRFCAFHARIIPHINGNTRKILEAVGGQPQPKKKTIFGRYGQDLQDEILDSEFTVLHAGGRDYVLETP